MSVKLSRKKRGKLNIKKIFINRAKILTRIKFSLNLFDCSKKS